jgi:inner membrane protein
MDPLSQAVVGAGCAQALSNKKHFITATILGLLAGMTADLDIFIRSDEDPMLFLEFHRQFTHSLLFIPIGGLICAGLFHLLFRKKTQLAFRWTYLYATVAYASHGLLDSCTSYGTQLFWPFSNHRVSWDTISIIDPIFTLPVLFLVVLATIKRSRRIAIYAVAWILLVQSFGLIQNQRASAVGYQLAAERGHQVTRLNAKPSFANQLLWRVVYETKEGFYIDAVRLGLKTEIIPGQFIRHLNIARDFPWLDQHSQQAKDIERFRWFSQGYIALDPKRPLRIIDIRYSLMPNETLGLWSIWLSPNASPEAYADYRMDRDIDPRQRKEFFDLLFQRSN